MKVNYSLCIYRSEKTKIFHKSEDVNIEILYKKMYKIKKNTQNNKKYLKKDFICSIIQKY